MLQDSGMFVFDLEGVVCTFQDGKPQFAVNKSISLPKEFHNDVETLLEKQLPDGSRYSNYA